MSDNVDRSLHALWSEMQKTAEDISTDSSRDGEGLANSGPPPDSRRMSDDPRFQLVEAKTDTKFAELIGEMRTGFARLDGRLDHIEKSTSGLKTTVIGTGIAVVAVTIAVMTYGQAWFGIGISTRDMIKATVTEMQSQTPMSQAPVPKRSD